MSVKGFLHLLQEAIMFLTRYALFLMTQPVCSSHSFPLKYLVLFYVYKGESLETKSATRYTLVLAPRNKETFKKQYDSHVTWSFAQTGYIFFGHTLSSTSTSKGDCSNDAANPRVAVCKVSECLSIVCIQETSWW